ncbi:MAG: phosphoribosylformylglycinamidine cyclo-ligase [Candidatus Lokiarchaeota archaeon]|nr:phosphoribosylformylglycinamidine cyclo-ligase [Candidatus Lokiarchaeota archaeon]
MADNKNIYSKLGVSSKKEDVHKAIEKLDKGLFPGSFCKIVKDVNNRKDYCSVFHADGAGTKSSLAYMYYKEIGDIDVFRGVVRDAIIMNVDDILCVGATDNMFLSNNIGRNSNNISGDILATIIDEYYSYSNKLTELGLNVIMCGGETADVGDVVKTVLLDASVFTSMKRAEVINAEDIQNDDVIIGLASSGKAIYEEEYNSGIGSNGLTLARHGILSHDYYNKYPECYDHSIDEELLFFGKYHLTDPLKGLNLTVGKALLSPTRTYSPILIEVLNKYRSKIHGIIHNTGGGQTKNLNYGRSIKYIKNNLFSLPQIFELIQNSSEIQWKEMFSVFNMGHRMELYCEEGVAKEIIKIATKYNVESKIIGHCEKSPDKNKNVVEINSEFGSFNYR